MKRFAWMGAMAAALAAALAGCNWDTGGDADSWSSSFDWVNFSGVYRGIGSGLLVTDYSTTPSIAGATNLYTKTESGGTLPATGTTASGQVSHGNIVPGSFTVTVGSIATLTDSGKNNVLTGDGSGTVNYEGGTWSIKLSTWSSSAQKITISYSYLVTTGGTTGGSGATGKIYAFNVIQQGQNVTITDNNGATYAGDISQIRSVAGAQNTDITQESDNAKVTTYESSLPADGDVIVANFECSGTSAALMHVKIVGALQGTVAAGVFTDRQLDGTWIESGGKTGNISGQTAAVAIPTSSSSAETPPPAAFAVSLK